MKRILAMVIILTLVLMVSSIFSQDPFSSGPGEEKRPMPGVLEAPPGVEEPPLEMYEPPIMEDELSRCCPDCDCHLYEIPSNPQMPYLAVCDCFIFSDCAYEYITMVEDQLTEIFGHPFQIGKSPPSREGPCEIIFNEQCFEIDYLRTTNHPFLSEVYRRFEQDIKEDPSLQEVCVWTFSMAAYDDTIICYEVMVEVFSHPCSELLE